VGDNEALVVELRQVMAKKSNPSERTVAPRPIESLIHVIRGQKAAHSIAQAAHYLKIPAPMTRGWLCASFRHWRADLKPGR
jgi:hypothetical protein